ncbi:Dicer-like protein 1 [Termitomyces sp. T112]|nr:Dicer-like protein 1 [Termitomyces sp. T112]KAH0587471.1 hypothetical protein H2248_006255 [Termitomyces sp. 'cryptogamus']
MLSVWKRSWKKKDTSINVLQKTLDGPSSSVSSLDSTAAAHPSDVGRIKRPHDEDIGHKRRYPDSLEFDDPPRKKVRLDRTDTLLNADLLEQVRQQNIILILRSEELIIQILTPFIISAVEMEKLRCDSTIKGPRTCLLVVEDNSSCVVFRSKLSSLAPRISVGQYEKSDKPRAELCEYVLRNDVVVTTPALLYEALSYGGLAMTQFHMLIFSNLSELCGQILALQQMIMKNFYLATDQLSRPRILGFLPFAPQNVPSEISGLEGITDFKVLHLDDYPFNQPSALFPEVVLFYENISLVVTSTLVKELQSLHLTESTDGFIRKHFNDSYTVLDEVGACASDLFWRRTMRESNGSSSCDFRVATDQIPLPDSVQNCIRDWTFALPNLDPASSKFNVTDKFVMLVKALRLCGPYEEAFRGIIFVKRLVVGLAIRDMLRMLDDCPLFFRPLLVTSDTLHFPSEHQGISHLFREGIYNILIMMELHRGIDTSLASVIVCFDTGFLDFGEDIGQAETTHVIHMIQKHEACPGGDEQLSETLNPSTIQCADDINPSTFLQDPTTGSRLYPRDSVKAVDRIASVGQLNGATITQVLSSFKKTQFPTDSERTSTCTVTLPGLVQLTGPPRQTESDARNVACFKLCQHLSSIGLLDCSFFSPPALLVDASNDANEGFFDPNAKTIGTRRYLRKEPDFWFNTRNATATLLYPLIISTTPENDVQPYAPLVILTRQPLPNLKSFKIFHSGIPSVVSIKRCTPLQIEEVQLRDLHLYTLRVCRTLSNKPFECLVSNMAYFFAPLTDAWLSSNRNDLVSPFKLLSIFDYIHWDLVSLAGRNFHTPLRLNDWEGLERDLHDAVVQDRSVEFTRRYTVVRLRRDLSPLSKPLDSPREAAFENILEYTKARRKSFEDLHDVNQPLIEVITIPAVLNQLNPTSRPTAQFKSHAKYLIPELCSKCTLPASVLRTARLLPSIMRRIDELLLVKELNSKLFDNKIADTYLHMALCTPSCGAEYDYERLELLGDAFLKFISSTYLFVSRPTHKEGSLHNARQDLISNKSLFQYACRAGIPSYIQSKLFSPRLWTPPFFTPLSPANRSDEAEVIERSAPNQTQEVKNITEQNTKKKRKKRRKRSQDDHSQWLGDKAVADVAEAILAAGYLTGGHETALQVTKALGIPILGISVWSDFAKKGPRASFNLSLKKASIEGVEAIIGYKVKQPQLLSQALSHSSVVGHDSTFTERLEFVGDAILDFMVIQHLYEREQHLTPGGLTLLKSAMVSNSALAAICVYSGLHEYFFHRSQPLQNSIRDYVAELEFSRLKEYQTAESEGRPPGQFWLELTAPKYLSDIVESIMGAVYVGDHFSTEGIQVLFEKLLKPFYDRYITLKTLSHHPTKILFELFQRQGCRRFTIQNDTKERKGTLTIAQVVVHDIILASAEDRDPAIAARRASFFALDALDGDSGFFARTCDCRIVQTSGKELIAKDKRSEQMYVEDESEVEAGRIMCELLPTQNSDLEEGMILD